ncbi:MAG: hypothetical protein FWF96_00725 [Kiritimatiellaeota bacterium]|nr:hypothetical protein [Kiritimatiellota bacterium]
MTTRDPQPARARHTGKATAFAAASCAGALLAGCHCGTPAMKENCGSQAPAREPEILLVEMPPCRMATSGVMADDDTFNRFHAMWPRLAARIADKINPRDFMYLEGEHDKPVWMFMLEDSMTEADTDGFEIITFPGGLFAAVLADNWEKSEYERVRNGVNAWLSRQEHVVLDERDGRRVMFHFAGPHSKQMGEWNYTKVRYFVPIKVKQ